MTIKNRMAPTIGVLYLWMMLALMAAAQGPSWWTNRSVINTNQPNDYGPVNQGQVKWLAKEAALEFSNTIKNFSSIGSNVQSLVNAFNMTNSNYAPVNLGQLKATAKPFYDVLLMYDFTGAYPLCSAFPYPWSSYTNPSSDFAIANVGQAKYLFSFNMNADENGNNIPDWWERYYGIYGMHGDLDHDGLLNMALSAFLWVIE